MGDTRIKIVGSYLSPYVRKILVCLDLKGITYEIDPIVPFFGSAEFSRISPLRRVPVLIDGDLVLSDSTVIAEYLHDVYPHPNLLPIDAAARGRARWLEEYADSRLGEVFIWHLYNQLVIRKYVWGLAPDQAVLTKALEQEIPGVLDYLETQVPRAAYIFGDISIADIAIASFFRNAAFARHQTDPERWPNLAGYVQRVLELDSFAMLQQFEAICLKTPIPNHREALLEAGAPICDETYATDTALAGIVAV
jgi:glutathione S-transferase